jgi:glutamine synthetase
VGEELEAVIDAIASDSPYAGPVKMKMDLGVDVLPKFSKDTTDRNRTSPFAFTGNKFEFRMPGSAENLSDCNTILNTAVAKELKGYADELEGAEDFTSAAIALVKRTIRDHRRVIFNGNGYTAEWEEEAAKRGLPNKKNTPAALPALIEPKNIALMEDFGVLTKVEMESRYEVEMEHYSKIINIEALTMLEMARKQLLPAVNAYMSEVANTAASKLAVSESISVRSETKTLALRRRRRHERRHRHPAGCRGCRQGSAHREREGRCLPRQRAPGDGRPARRCRRCRDHLRRGLLASAQLQQDALLRLIIS